MPPELQFDQRHESEYGNDVADLTKHLDCGIVSRREVFEHLTDGMIGATCDLDGCMTFSTFSM